MYCSQAPGKVILFGEHFVVKGFPGIGVAVNMYAKACSEAYEKNHVYSRQLGVLYDEEKNIGRENSFDKIFEILRELGCLKRFKVFIDSEIYIASGMGSSAAVSVAVAHSLLRACGHETNKDLVSKIAFEAEKIIHKKPSGIDNTLATYGGFIYYKAGVFKRIDVSWPEDYELLITNTGIERNTGVVVREVLELYERRKNIIEHVYYAAERLVEEAVMLLKNGDIETLGELMNINQGLLYSINTSCQRCEEIIWLLRRFGALGAKISGAGRGGIVIALFRKKDLEKNISEINRYINNIFIAKPDLYGVRSL